MRVKEDDFILVGKIVGAHGVKGTVRILLYSGSDSALFKADSLYIKETEGDLKRYEITSLNLYGNIVRANLEGIVSRTQAKDIAGSFVFLTKNSLDVPEEGVWYWFELIGLSVLTKEGEPIGIVESIFPTGANDILVVKEKKTDKEILVPAIEPIVTDVDMKKKILWVDLPDGLM